MFKNLDKKVNLALTLAIISGVSALLLAFVNDFTAPVIAKNKEEQTLALYSELFEDMSDYEEESHSENVESIVGIYDNDEKIGIVCSSSGKNSYGSITALVGYNSNKEVVGVEYSGFNQTPGFGDKVKKEEYIDQYIGDSVDTIGADTASGATFSSNLVLDLVSNCSEEVNDMEDDSGAEANLKKYVQFFKDITNYKDEEHSETVNAVVSAYKDEEKLGSICSVSGSNEYGEVTALIGYDKDSKIVDIKYDEYTQNDEHFNVEKRDEYTKQFIGNSSKETPTDTVTSATASSKLILDLVSTCSTEIE